MDVTCERCSTEYEFDDALVSERGTTVKCTNCGFQFKVRRTSGSAPETWLVRTVDGRELEFTLLRDLQAAITRSEITRDDVLSRGNARPRRLGSIAELEPFFKGIGGMLGPGTASGLGPPAPGPRVRNVTPQGLGGPVPRPSLAGAGAGAGEERAPDSMSDSETVVINGPIGGLAPFARPASAPPPPPSGPADADPLAPDADRMPIVPPTPPPGPVEPARRAAVPGTVVPPDDAPPLPEGYLVRPADAPATQRGGFEAASVAAAEPASPSAGQASAAARAGEGADAAGPNSDDAPPAGRRGHRPSALTFTPAPTDARISYFNDEAYGEPRFTSMMPSRRSGAARWIVGLVVVGLAALAGVVLVPRYLKPSAPAPGATSDARVEALVADAERVLREGDVETARDKVLQASTLAENDPRVAAELARLETISADLRWLRLRLMEERDPDQAVARHDFDVAVGRARTSVERAEKLAPEEVAVKRARVDLLRLQGDVGRARELVGAIASGSAQPENALSLAALDLAEAQPSWAVAIGRLRTAVGGEQSLGRARALLVYALARSGDLATARAEHERLAAAARPHTLAPALRAFIERLEAESPAARGGGAKDRDAGAGTAGGARAAPPAAGERPRAPRAPTEDGRVPDDYVAPDQGVPVDTSDLPGHAPPASSAPASAPAPASSTPPPEIDTSDLPGIKNE